jgi:hypothetical protein
VSLQTVTIKIFGVIDNPCPANCGLSKIFRVCQSISEPAIQNNVPVRGAPLWVDFTISKLTDTYRPKV